MLNSLTWNAVKTQQHQSKYDYENDSETNLATANNQLISIKVIVKLIVLRLEIMQQY